MHSATKTRARLPASLSKGTYSGSLGFIGCEDHIAVRRHTLYFCIVTINNIDVVITGLIAIIFITTTIAVMAIVVVVIIAILSPLVGATAQVSKGTSN